MLSKLWFCLVAGKQKVGNVVKTLNIIQDGKAILEVF